MKDHSQSGGIVSLKPATCITLSAVIGLGTILGCTRASRTGVESIPHVRAHNAVVCGDTSAFQQPEGLKPSRFGMMVQSWSTWHIPEYQDAQRFSTGPSPMATYGPLACVAARPNLDALLASDFAGDTGILVAVVFVDASAPLTSKYTSINLQQGWNCVMLRGVAPNYQAFIVPSVNERCAIGNAPNIGVASFTNPTGTGPADVPAVARFVLRPNGDVGVGVRCVDAWCVAGMTNIGQADPPPQSQAPGPNFARRVIPGWFDLQFIAAYDATAPFRLRPGFRASVVPDANLESYNNYHDFGTKRHVATVTFAGNPTGKYQTHWGFVPGDNEMDLQWIGPGEDDWKVFINGVERSGLKVNFTNHAPTLSRVVGTARFAWKDGREGDEGVWVRCAVGCCEVDTVQ